MLIQPHQVIPGSDTADFLGKLTTIHFSIHFEVACKIACIQLTLLPV